MEKKREEERRAGERADLVSEESCRGMDRRDFVKLGIGSAVTTATGAAAASSPLQPGGANAATAENPFERLGFTDWPVLKTYDEGHLSQIAFPLGGIGTGTVSLAGNGNLRDWEVMNRPAKGFVPSQSNVEPFFALWLKAADGTTETRVLEGPVAVHRFEGSHGSEAPNVNLPRFRDCRFGAAYPLAQVLLSDPDMPVEVRIKAFNPLIPCDSENSAIPVAVLRYELTNRTGTPLDCSVCGTVPNFVGMDGSKTATDWKGDPYYVGAKGNRNSFRSGSGLSGIHMESEGVDPQSEQWGSFALTTTSREGISYRLNWAPEQWGTSILDFWDDFSSDGKLDQRPDRREDSPIGSLAVSLRVPPRQSRTVTFLLAWRFPNRYTWTPASPPTDEDRIGNHYATRYKDAWEAAVKTAGRLEELEKGTLSFVRSFCTSSLPEEVKEAALFNISTLRTQTCFRTPDGRFYGWEGSSARKGCCHGSCTHVWNYEQATAYLFGELAMTMREVEFAHATNEEGLMSFRVHLPLNRSRHFGKGAADGQMGCLMKMYRDWQLSGDDQRLRELWPGVRKALEFCWIEGGWDADRDGVMEGCQHNTMDVEYYGPNPQMGIWYLGALRAAEEMARHLGEAEFAGECRKLFENGSRWIDANLFNSEYYEHQVRPPQSQAEIAPSLLIGMGARDVTKPDFQLGAGCLVDQLVGQFMAHVCGLGYLLEPANVRRTLQSILEYNRREGLHSHFNTLRTFALADETALLMATYPRERPEKPFSYFTEVMTGFEYTAAVGMIYEGMVEEGLMCIRDIRRRYDGRRRNPFDEAECGHHYARAMSSWAAILALTGFRYSAVDQTLALKPREGRFFWSNGYAWGTCSLRPYEREARLELSVDYGELTVARIELEDFGATQLEAPKTIPAGAQAEFRVTAGD
jgi:non-lysosomal glucosylceramidase